MSFSRQVIGAFGGAFLLFLALPGRAFAYVDPGTGALLWQAVLAAFFGSLFFLRSWWIRIVARFSALRGRGYADEAGDDAGSS